MIIWFQRSAGGRRVFRNTTGLYFKTHGVYPTVHEQLPKFITELGYKCEPATAYFIQPVGGEDVHVENKGLDIEDEDVLPFMIRFG